MGRVSGTPTDAMGAPRSKGNMSSSLVVFPFLGCGLTSVTEPRYSGVISLFIHQGIFALGRVNGSWKVSEIIQSDIVPFFGLTSKAELVGNNAASATL